VAGVRIGARENRKTDRIWGERGREREALQIGKVEVTIGGGGGEKKGYYVFGVKEKKKVWGGILKTCKKTRGGERGVVPYS